MKKFALAMMAAALVAGCGAAFAQDADGVDNASGGYYYEEGSVGLDIGFSAGVRISLLGVEPEFSVVYKMFEAAVFAPMHAGTDYGTDQSLFGVGVGGSIGWVQSHATKGWQNALGVQYLWLSEPYLRASLIGSALMESGDGYTFNSAHIVGGYWRGTIKFSPHFGGAFRLVLPFYAGFGGDYNVNMLDTVRAWACWLICPLTISIGLRWEF